MWSVFDVWGLSCKAEQPLWTPLVCLSHRSVDFDDSPTGSDPSSRPLLGETTGDVAPETTDCGSGQPGAAAEGFGEEIPLQEINCTADETMSKFHEHHRRLLPNCKNAIHVLDGPNRRYFVGIIDIFTVYGWKKRLENMWKSLRYPGRAFSTVRPAKYSHRFCQWVQEHTEWTHASLIHITLAVWPPVSTGLGGVHLLTYNMNIFNEAFY